MKKAVAIHAVRKRVKETGITSLSASITVLKGFLQDSEFYMGKHIMLGRFLKDCADFMMENSAYEEADALFKKANDIYSHEALSPSSVRNVDVFSMLLQNWGINKSFMGCNVEALKDFEQSLKIIRQMYPPTNKFTYKANKHLSEIFYQLYVTHGLNAWSIANSLRYTAEPRIQRDLQYLLGPSIIKACEDGTDETLISDVR